MSGGREFRYSLVNLSEPKAETAVACPSFSVPFSGSLTAATPYISEQDYSGPGAQDQVPLAHTMNDPFVHSSPVHSNRFSGQHTQHPANSSLYSSSQHGEQNASVTVPSPPMRVHCQSPATVDTTSSVGYLSEDSNDSVVQSTHSAAGTEGQKPLVPHTIHRYIVVQPGEDAEKATADAINDIAKSLNREAAEKMARGQVPNHETVIEVTRIQSPADGYFTRENVIKKRCNPRVSVLLQSASTLEQGHRTPEKNMMEAHTKKCHPMKYSNDSQWSYRTPTPPRIGEMNSYLDSVDLPQQHNENCYYNGASTKGFQFRMKRQNLAPCTQTASSLLDEDSNSEPVSSGNYKGVQSSKENDSKKLNDSLTSMQWLEAMNGRSSNADKESPALQPPDLDLNNKSVSKQPAMHRDMRLIATERQIEKISQECGRNKRPPFSYMHLIQMAIWSRVDRKMTLKQIYQWIEEKFPYYKYHPSQGWRNSIRHNLSLYDIFVREKPNLPGQTGCSYWTLRPDMEPKPTRLKHSALITEIQPDTRSPSPAFPPQQTPVVVMPPLPGSEAAEPNIPTAKNKKGPVPLLPKPGGPVQAYALIPIQGGVPVIPQQPVLVQSTPGASTKAVSSLGGSHPKDPLKRNHSPGSVTGAPKKKLPKLLIRPNILGNRSRRRSDSTVNDSTSSFDSGLGNSLTGSLNLSQSQQESIVETKSLCRSLSDSSSSITGVPTFASDTPKGLPRPKMYDRRKSKLVPKNYTSEETRSPDLEFTSSGVKATTSKDSAQEAVSLNDSEFSDCGISDILAGIEGDLSSPIRNLLKTPPKDSCSKNLLTSTPFGDSLGSPSWLSPIKLLTPLMGDANKDTSVITPASAGSKVHISAPGPFETSPSPAYFTQLKNSTPKSLDASPQLKGFTPSKVLTGSPLCFKAEEHSPRAGSLRGLGIPGLTPLKSPRSHVGTSPSPNDSFAANQSFTKLFGEFHLDSMLDDGINMDVGNFSFL